MAKQKKLLIVTSHEAFQPHDHHTIKKCLYHNKITAKKKRCFFIRFSKPSAGGAGGLKKLFIFLQANGFSSCIRLLTKQNIGTQRVQEFFFFLGLANIRTSHNNSYKSALLHVIQFFKTRFDWLHDTPPNPIGFNWFRHTQRKRKYHSDAQMSN